MSINKRLGRRLAYGRDLAGLTQPEMALRLRGLGIDVSTDKIKSIESGRRPVRALEVAGYAQVCEVEPGWFYQDLPGTFGDAIPGLFDPEPVLAAAA